jgi:hypothetical protein
MQGVQKGVQRKGWVRGGFPMLAPKKMIEVAFEP